MAAVSGSRRRNSVTFCCWRSTDSLPALMVHSWKKASRRRERCQLSGPGATSQATCRGRRCIMTGLQFRAQDERLMNHEAGFLQAIIDNPDDDAVRLIYA